MKTIITLTDSGKVIYRNLAQKDKSSRQLGTISGETFSTFRNPANHLFHALNAYSLYYRLLKMEWFHWVKIVTPSYSLLTSRLYWLHNSKLLKFRGDNAELQAFLNLNEFGYEKARIWEESIRRRNNLRKTNIEDSKLKSIQLDLFGK